jgi:hypothetical protein
MNSHCDEFGYGGCLKPTVRKMRNPKNQGFVFPSAFVLMVKAQSPSLNPLSGAMPLA